MAELVIACILALAAGLLLGWLLAGRRTAVAEARAADFDIVRQARDAVERERNDAVRELTGLRERLEGREAELRNLSETHMTSVRELREISQAHAEVSQAHAGLKERADEREQAHVRALEQMQQQFDAAAAKVLESAQRQFLERADARFRQSEEASGQKLAQLLQPVSERLQRWMAAANAAGSAPGSADLAAFLAEG